MEANSKKCPRCSAQIQVCCKENYCLQKSDYITDCDTSTFVNNYKISDRKLWTRIRICLFRWLNYKINAIIIDTSYVNQINYNISTFSILQYVKAIVHLATAINIWFTVLANVSSFITRG